MADVWHDWGQLSEFLNHARTFMPQDDVEDCELLLASVLIHSYALAESAAAAKLECEWRDLGPIERWGLELLDRQQKSWSRVSGKLHGAVEVAVVRNALAHGQREFDVVSIDRLARVWPDGQEVPTRVSLDYTTLGRFRGRLQSLLNHGGLTRGLPTA